MLPLTVNILHVCVHTGIFLIIQTRSNGIGYCDFSCSVLFGEGDH